MKTGGIILCGGKSTRMGLPKATLPFGEETMLARVVRLLGEVVDPIVVVAAPNQQLPQLPVGVLIARDRRESRGPLEGLSAGLSAIRQHADAAYATSCDVPLLVPPVVTFMIRQLGQRQIAVPKDGKYHHPLAAVYRTSVLPAIEELLEANRLRPFFLFERCETCEVDASTLRGVDPALATLRNLNHPSDYFAALKDAGLQAPPEIRQLLGEGNA